MSKATKSHNRFAALIPTITAEKKALKRVQNQVWFGNNNKNAPAINDKITKSQSENQQQISLSINQENDYVAVMIQKAYRKHIDSRLHQASDDVRLIATKMGEQVTDINQLHVGDIFVVAKADYNCWEKHTYTAIVTSKSPLTIETWEINTKEDKEPSSFDLTNYHTPNEPFEFQIRTFTISTEDSINKFNHFITKGVVFKLDKEYTQEVIQQAFENVHAKVTTPKNTRAKGYLGKMYNCNHILYDTLENARKIVAKQPK